MKAAILACRDLAARARFGALATLTREATEAREGGPEPAGWPFATLVALAFDERLRPLLLLSRLAEHTRNLEACPRASLLVSESVPPPGAAHPGSSPPAAAPAGRRADPLAEGRMTLVGHGAPVAHGENGESEASRALARFVAAHPQAASYAGFADFAIWRIEVAHVRWVGGFGRMEWLSQDEYTAASAT